MNGKRARAKRRLPPTIKLPDEQAAMVEAAMELDRAYFREHPDAEWYVRPLQPGETSGAPVDMSGNTHVLVRQFGPGIRQRLFMTQERAIELAVAQAEGVEIFLPENEVTAALRKAVVEKFAYEAAHKQPYVVHTTGCLDR